MTPRRYRVDFDAEPARFLNELIVADRSISSDLREFENDLQTAPHVAGQQKVGGQYVGQRGPVELTYFVDDGDLRVRVIRARRRSHPYDVVLSRDVTQWLWSHVEMQSGELALSVINQRLPQLLRDPRWMGRRVSGNSYRLLDGRIELTYEVSEADARVTVTSIQVSDT